MSRARAFTIVEIIVASIIIAMIAGTTTVVISRSLAAKDASTSRAEAFQRATTAAEFIARDLRSVARESDPSRVRLAVGDSGAGASTLLMLASGAKRLRPQSDVPEGPVHAVQFRLGPAAATGPVAEGSTLWRRVDPVPNEYLDAGGVASALVPGISSLVIEAGDGDTWSTTWDSDTDGLPHVVRVAVSASAGASQATQRTATARVVVALDRTPLPTGPLAAPAASTASTPQPATQQPAGGGGTTQPGQGGGTFTPGGGGQRPPGGGPGGQGGPGGGGQVPPGGGQGGQQGPPGGGGQPAPGSGTPGQQPPGPGTPPPGGGGGRP
ncbi:MAG: hypothetical protein ACKVS8_05790 [Phycisphaerales bacterium]